MFKGDVIVKYSCPHVRSDPDLNVFQLGWGFCFFGFIFSSKHHAVVVCIRFAILIYKHAASIWFIKGWVLGGIATKIIIQVIQPLPLFLLEAARPFLKRNLLSATLIQVDVIAISEGDLLQQTWLSQRLRRLNFLISTFLLANCQVLFLGTEEIRLLRKLKSWVLIFICLIPTWFRFLSAHHCFILFFVDFSNICQLVVETFQKLLLFVWLLFQKVIVRVS